MLSIHLLLLLGAAICFALVALNIGTARINLTGLGLLLFTLSFLIG